MKLLALSQCTLFKMGIEGVFSSLEQTDKNFIIIDIENLPDINGYYPYLGNLDIIFVYKNPLDLYLFNQILIDSIMCKFRVCFILKKSPIKHFYNLLSDKGHHRRIQYVFHNYLSIKENKVMDLYSQDKTALQVSTALGITLSCFSTTKRSIMSKLQVKSDCLLYQKVLMRKNVNNLLFHLLNQSNTSN